jgi:hypothetical protein
MVSHIGAALSRPEFTVVERSNQRWKVDLSGPGPIRDAAQTT